MKVKFVLFLLILFVIGCKSVDINSASPIMVPSGLSLQDVKVAILNAVNPKENPIKLTPYQQITDSALKAHYGFLYKSINTKRRWFLEDIRKDSLLVGYDNGNYYFRVEYKIGKSQIIQRIDGSRNLDQTETTIHKGVFQKLGQMEVNIRKELGMIASRQK